MRLAGIIFFVFYSIGLRGQTQEVGELDSLLTEERVVYTAESKFHQEIFKLLYVSSYNFTCLFFRKKCRVTSLCFTMNNVIRIK
jgi:hypothetical protein